MGDFGNCSVTYSGPMGGYFNVTFDVCFNPTNHRNREFHGFFMLRGVIFKMCLETRIDHADLALQIHADQ